MINVDRLIVRGEIFNDIGDYLNELTFLVETPLYTTNLPELIEEDEFVPSWWINLDKNETGITRLNIATMIDYYHKSIPFTIVNDEDVVFITELLKEYLDQVNKLDISSIQDEYRVFINKAKAFYERMFFLTERLVRSNALAQDLIQKSSLLTNILNNYAK